MTDSFVVTQVKSNPLRKPIHGTRHGQVNQFKPLRSLRLEKRLTDLSRLLQICPRQLEHALSSLAKDNRRFAR